MTKIILTDEQAQALVSSNGEDVLLVDSAGKRLGSVLRPTFSETEIAEAERRAGDGGPWHTTEQVIAHLKTLAPE